MHVCVCVCVFVCVYVCGLYANMYVYVCNSGPPIVRSEERHGSVLKSRAQSLVIGVLYIE